VNVTLHTPLFVLETLLQVITNPVVHWRRQQQQAEGILLQPAGKSHPCVHADGVLVAYLCVLFCLSACILLASCVNGLLPQASAYSASVCYAALLCSCVLLV